MKERIIALALFLTCHLVQAQVIYDFEKDEALIERVIKAEGVKSDELYDKAKVWMAKNLKSSDEQILNDDPNKQTLIGTGNLYLPDQTYIREKIVNYKISLYFKDDRFKVIINELVYSWVSVSMDLATRTPGMVNLDESYKRVFSKKKGKKKKVEQQIDEEFEKLLNDLETTLNGKDEIENDDW